MELIPICIPKFDWTLFVKVANQLTGREVTRDLDSSNVDLTKYPGQIDLLDKVILGAENHLSFSFVLQADSEIIGEACQLCDLRFSTIGNQGALISGTLRQWLIAINQYCSPKANTQTRYIYNQAAWYFEQLGFSFLKEPVEDGTWQLAK